MKVSELIEYLEKMFGRESTLPLVIVSADKSVSVIEEGPIVIHYNTQDMTVSPQLYWMGNSGPAVAFWVPNWEEEVS
jgi:hypothetical protein